MKTTAIVLAAVLLSAPFAAAQDDKSEGDSGAWAPVKHLKFTDEDVRVGLVGPEGEPIDVVQRAPQPSLIELRLSFAAEVVKTMEDM